MTDCPDHNQLLRFLDGDLSDTDRATIDCHVDECEACQSVVADVVAASAEPPPPPVLSEAFAGAVAARLANAGLQPASDSGSFEPRRIGAYVTLSKLGDGGMGTVYLAEHSHLKKQVALKVLKKTGSETMQARFAREMQSVGKLTHPHIVQATDAGHADGVSFIAMELLDGYDARVLTGGRAIAVADACEIVRQTAFGLQYAHEQGLVHRDVKPSNVMVTREGVVKLLDLGLARFSEAMSVAEEITLEGEVLGTLDYMSPEQCRDPETVGPRSDIFSLGATLFRLLSGEPPFRLTATTLAKLTALAVDSPRSLREVRPDLPEDLIELVDQMLQSDPANRVQTAGEVAQRLQPFCNGATLQTLQPPLRQADIGTIVPTSDTTLVVTPSPDNRGGRRRTGKRLRLALGAIAALLLGSIIYVRFGDSTLRIEINDPNITARVDDGNVVIRNGTETIKLQPGDHTLKIKRGDFEFTTNKFSLTRRKKEVLVVEYVDGEITVAHDGRVIDSREVVDGLTPATAIHVTPQTTFSLPNAGTYYLRILLSDAQLSTFNTIDFDLLSISGGGGVNSAVVSQGGLVLQDTTSSGVVISTIRMTPDVPVRPDVGLGSNFRITDIRRAGIDGSLVVGVETQSRIPAGKVRLLDDAAQPIAVVEAEPAVELPKFDTGLRLTEAADEVVFPTLFDQTDALTIEVWIKRDDTQPHSQIVGFSREAAIYTNANAVLDGFHAGDARAVADKSMLTKGCTQPVHVAIVRDPQKPRHTCFVDGEAVFTTRYIAPKSNTCLAIGGNQYQWNPAAYSFMGSIHELRVSDSVRYRENFKPERRFTSDANTIALYHFDDGAGTVVTDSSGNKHHGRISGAEWIRPPPSAAKLIAELLDYGVRLTVNPPGSSDWHSVAPADWAKHQESRCGIQFPDRLEVPDHLFIGAIEAFPRIASVVTPLTNLSPAALRKLEGLSLWQFVARSNVITREQMAAIARCSELERLDFYSTQIDEQHLELIAQLTNLESLNISSNSIAGNQLHHLLGMSTLRKLHLSNGESVPLNDEAMRTVGKLQSLEVLEFTVDVETDLTPVAELPNLRELSVFSSSAIKDISPLTRSKVGTFSVAPYDASYVDTLRKLKELRAFNSWRDEATALDSRQLKQLCDVTTITNLTIAVQPDADLASLADMPNLRYIELLSPAPFKDVSPLSRSGITDIVFTPYHRSYLPTIEKMETLKSVQRLPRSDFLKSHRSADSKESD